jgi:hypothetical protein
MDKQYFTRKINEGTVKRTHICSFDKTIKLEIVVVGSKKVVDYLIKSQANAYNDEKIAESKSEAMAKENFMRSVSGLRVNGLPIIYEELGNCFDSEEIMEVVAFINDSDMSIFGGEKTVKRKNA